MFSNKSTEFENLVRAYSAELYRYAYWLARDRFVAEDVVQETFTRAWSAWSRIRDPKAVKKWLYTIVHNEHARLYERKRLDLVSDQDLDALEGERLREMSLEYEMREALATLPDGYRDPLLLQVVGGFSCDEIAQIMGLSPAAAMTRLSRARLALRKQAQGSGQKKVSL